MWVKPIYVDLKRTAIAEMVTDRNPSFPQPGVTEEAVTVSVSEKARELAAFAPTRNAEAKVDHLRMAIQNETFVVNPQVVAERLVDGQFQ